METINSQVSAMYTRKQHMHTHAHTHACTRTQTHQKQLGHPEEMNYDTDTSSILALKVSKLWQYTCVDIRQ